MVFGCAGCASTQAIPEDGAPWLRVRTVPGCRAADINLRLQPDFQTALMKQLDQQPLEAPLCWYQTPGGDLLLRAGNFCGLSHEAQFRLQGSQWTLVRMEHVLGQCGSKG